MATRENAAGLLSKMARFVRNPTKDWSELDLPEPVLEMERESGYSKLALKELIQRKRQNDFVRRREFDQLRKLRRNGLLISPELVGRPSFFQSSSTSNLDDRARTIKKIDEIEAQMSKQWWKGKKDEAAGQASGFPVSVKAAPSLDSERPGYSSSLAAEVYESTQPFDLNPTSGLLQSSDYAPTQMGLAAPEGEASGGGTTQTVHKGLGSKGDDSRLSAFSNSQLFSVKLGDSLDDPDLEEAAIRFANGDDAGAETTLLAALHADNVMPENADGWAAALFDLYRSTGQQVSFDRVAIEYAQLFGRSAPAWFSTPALLGLGKTLKSSTGAAMAASTWTCPAQLASADVQDLSERLEPTAQIWRLDWSGLEGLTADGGSALMELFARWCRQAIRLQFDAAEVLEKVLKATTPSGDQQVEPYWWRLRMDALRLMGLQDDFELAALDFCVTYEVSPPAWEAVCCEYIQTGTRNPARHADDHGLFDGSQQLTQPGDLVALANVPMELNTGANVVELAGEVIGDAAEALDALQAGFKGAKRLVISCARLIRVDFSAAGSILNWVAARDMEGCQVQFHDVPRLVAAFFHVIGINEHAQVNLRAA
jgi:ABC-type transporter Mla MlaB component